MNEASGPMKNREQIREGTKGLREQVGQLKDLRLERNRLAQALQESETRFQDLANSIVDVFFVMDQNLNITYWNSASEKLMGIPASEAIGRHLHEIFPSAWGTTTEQLYRQVIHTQKSQTFVHEMRLHGQVYFFEVNAYPTRDGILVLSRDVTSRRHAEKLLRIQRDLGVSLSSTIDLKEALSRALDAALKAEGIDCGCAYLVGPRNLTIDIACHRGLSAQFISNATQVDPDSQQGDLMTSDRPIYICQSDILFSQDAHVQREGLRSVAILPVHHAGQVVASLNVGSRSKNEISTSARHVLEAISAQIGAVIARAQTSAALRESEERFRTVADFTYDWEYWMSPSGEFLYSSPSCERITGYHPGEFRADPGLLEAITHIDDRDQIRRHLQEEIHQQTNLELTFRIVTRQHQVLWIGHVCQPVYRADGSWAGQRASNRDITRQIEAEESLRSKETFLETILEHAGHAVFVVDVLPTGGFRYAAANPAYTEAIGASPLNIQGKTLDELEAILDSGTIPAIASKYETCATSGRMIEFDERLLAHSETGWWHTTLFPICGPDGRVKRIIGAALSVQNKTEKKTRLKSGRRQTRASPGKTRNPENG